MGIWQTRYTPLAVYAVVLSLCLLPNSAFYAQTFQETVDSLIKKLPTVQEAKAHVDLLNEISYTNRRISGDSTLKYGRMAQKAAIEADYIRGQSIAHKNMGIGHYKMASPRDSMVYHYEKAITFAEKINDYYTQAACYNNLALLFSYKEKPYTVIQYYLIGIDIFDTHIKEEKSLKALMLANLAQFHGALEEYDKGLGYIERAFDIARRNNYTQILSIYADDYGRILIKKKQFEKATKIFAEGLKLNEALADKSSKAWNWSYQVDLALAQQQCEKAEKQVKLAYDYAVQEKMAEPTTYNTLGFAKVALCKKEYGKVVTYGEKMLETHGAKNADLIIKTVNIKQEARLLLAKAMEGQGKFEEAYFYTKTYHAINDSILQKRKLAHAAEMETKYQLVEKEKAIDVLQGEQSITNRFIRRLWTFLGIIALAGLYILYLLFKRKEANELINTKNQELEKYIASNLQLENFAYIASHDLRSPLSTITSFAQLLKKETKGRLVDVEMEYLNFIDSSAENMMLLLEDIMKFSTLQKSLLNKEKIHVSEFVRNFLEANKNLIKEHQIEITSEINVAYLKADRSKLQQLMQNLLANAIKYRKAEVTPRVAISVLSKKGAAVFSMKDNGIGIESAYFERIFLLFKRLHNKTAYQGTGIGLAICKKIVEMHDGKIWVTSTLGEGATFSFSLPK